MATTHTYAIQFGKGADMKTAEVTAESPTKAFRQAFPGYVVAPTYYSGRANVRIDNLTSIRPTTCYYIARKKGKTS